MERNMKNNDIKNKILLLPYFESKKLKIKSPPTRMIIKNNIENENITINPKLKTTGVTLLLLLI